MRHNQVDKGRESGARDLNSQNLARPPTADGCSSPGEDRRLPEGPPLKAILSLEVGLAFSSGLEGILGSIQCASGCRHFDKATGSPHPEEESLFPRVSKKVYNDTRLWVEIFRALRRDQRHAVDPRGVVHRLAFALGFIKLRQLDRISHPLAKSRG